MHISSVAPILIAYLLGVATPILMASQMNHDEDHGEGCFFLLVLAGICVAIMAVFYLWVAESMA